MTNHFKGWLSDEHKDTFDVWNKMSRCQFNYIFSSFEENKYLLENLNKNEIDSILDYGCSSGYVKRYLNLKNFNNVKYNGFDISEKSVTIAKKKYGENFFFNDASQILDKKYDLVYSRDTILHQPNPWKFIDEIVSKTKKKLILRLRTRDFGNTLLDVDKSCQLIAGEYWVPYIVLNFEEFINYLSTKGFKSIKANRSYSKLGGHNSRFLEKSLYLKKTGTSETSIVASYEAENLKGIEETFNLEGHNYLKQKKYLSIFYKILNKLRV